jgi:hypothetical protein
MGGPFGRTRGGDLRMELDDAERRMLRALALQVVSLVEPPESAADADPLEALVGISADASMPDDPALARLLPDAFRDDDEAAAEFRRYTERGLREGKAANAAAVVALLDSGTDRIPQDAVPALLGMVNDARLVVGVRLGITEEIGDDAEDVAPDDPRFGMFQVYYWLTYLEESLVQELLA